MWAAQLSLVPREMSLLGAFPAFPFPTISANSAGCQGSVTAQHPNQQTQQIQRTGRHRRMLGWHLAEQHWASTQHGLFTVRPHSAPIANQAMLEVEATSKTSAEELDEMLSASMNRALSRAEVGGCRTGNCRFWNACTSHDHYESSHQPLQEHGRKISTSEPPALVDGIWAPFGLSQSVLTSGKTWRLKTAQSAWLSFSWYIHTIHTIHTWHSMQSDQN